MGIPVSRLKNGAEASCTKSKTTSSPQLIVPTIISLKSTSFPLLENGL